MRAMLSLLVVVAFGLTAAGQDRMTVAEAAFLKNGPTLYTMDEALKVSEQTGKPVVCWMGKHLFANPEARRLSSELGETTIQAAMDTDGTEYDRVGFRVKFSDGNYKDTAKTFYIPLNKFDRAGTAERILATARGGK